MALKQIQMNDLRCIDRGSWFGFISSSELSDHRKTSANAALAETMTRVDRPTALVSFVAKMTNTLRKFRQGRFK